MSTTSAKHALPVSLTPAKRYTKKPRQALVSSSLDSLWGIRGYCACFCLQKTGLMDSCGEGVGCVYYIVDLQKCVKLQYSFTKLCNYLLFVFTIDGQARLVRIVRLQTDNLHCR